MLITIATLLLGWALLVLLVDGGTASSALWAIIAALALGALIAFKTCQALN